MHSHAIDGATLVVDPSAYIHPTAVLIGDVAIGPPLRRRPMRVAARRRPHRQGPRRDRQDTAGSTAFPAWRRASTTTDTGLRRGAARLRDRTRRAGRHERGRDGESEVGGRAGVAASSLVPAGMKIDAATLVGGVPAEVGRPPSEVELAWKDDRTQTQRIASERCLRSMREVVPLTTRPGARGGRATACGS